MLRRQLPNLNKAHPLMTTHPSTMTKATAMTMLSLSKKLRPFARLPLSQSRTKVSHPRPQPALQARCKRTCHLSKTAGDGAQTIPLLGAAQRTTKPQQLQPRQSLNAFHPNQRLWRQRLLREQVVTQHQLKHQRASRLQATQHRLSSQKHCQNQEKTGTMRP
jgi:hypothetical protein